VDRITQSLSLAPLVCVFCVCCFSSQTHIAPLNVNLLHGCVASRVLPRELYLNFLLQLLAMYFLCVDQIFRDVEVSRPDIEQMINNSGGAGAGMPTAPQAGDPNASPLLQDSITGRLVPRAVPAMGISTAGGAATAISMTHMPLLFPDEWSLPLVSPALVQFKHSWEDFIDSLLREWKTLNVVLALLAL
jgi:hypothetical protein